MKWLRHWINLIIPRPVRRHAFAIGMLMLVASAVIFTTGCAGLPVWLSTADQFLPVAVSSIGSILVAIGVISGNPALAAAAAMIAKIASEAELAIKDLEAMVAEYKASPNETLLASIENAAQAAIDHVQSLLGDFGLPPELSAPFVALAQLILSQLEAWTGVLPALKLAYQDHDVEGVKMAAAHMKSIPLTPDQFKEAFNNVVLANPQLGAVTI